VPRTPKRSGFCPFPRALHTEDVLLKTRLRQGLPLARLGAAQRERAQAAVADGLVLSDGDRLVLTYRGRLSADAVVPHPAGVARFSGDREPVPDDLGDLDIDRDPDGDVIGKRQTQRCGQRQRRARLGDRQTLHRRNRNV
jgi:hypothetical protein